MKPVAAVFLGFQDLTNGRKVALFNLLADIPGHPKDSTVSAQTLVELGYRIPPILP